MILSRTFAKQRMAANVRPSWADAWLLVVADVALVLVALLMITPALGTYIYAMQPDDATTMIFVILLYLVLPLAILIVGCIWARRSRRLQA